MSVPHDSKNKVLEFDGFDVDLIPNLRSPGGTASMHTKFTVVNDELVVTGSANLSASASLAKVSSASQVRAGVATGLGRESLRRLGVVGRTG